MKVGDLVKNGQGSVGIVTGIGYDGKDDYLCGGNTPERVEEQIEWLKKKNNTESGRASQRSI